MDSTQIGLVSSIFTLGGLCGALAAGPISTRYGRLRAMQWTTLPFILGPVFEAFAINIAMMAVGRFISGLGAGAAVVVVPIYISEVAPPGEKGFFGAFTQIMVNVGIAIALVLGFFLSFAQNWRIILGVGGMLGILLLAGLFLVPESPKYMADKGHPNRARKVLRQLRGHKFNVEDEVHGWGVEGEDVEEDEEESLIQRQDRMSHSNEERDEEPSKRSEARKEMVSMWHVIRNPEYNKAAIAVIMVMLAQQLCGTYYGASRSLPTATDIIYRHQQHRHVRCFSTL